jgi:hypothetical protein
MIDSCTHTPNRKAEKERNRTWKREKTEHREGEEHEPEEGE